MTTDRNDQYREPESGDPEFAIETSGLEDIDEYAARAALDSSGYWFNLLGKDSDGHGHYLKDGGDHGEIAVLNRDQDVIDTREIVHENGVTPRRVQSYVWEHEWQELTEYGAAWLDE
jgi:hypothetical protein